MNWLQFIAALVGSLAWPATVLVAVLMFRKQLLALAPFLREMEAAGIKFKFGERLEKIRAQAEENDALPPPSAQPEIPNQPGQASYRVTTDPTRFLAFNAPRALVLESWMQVEEAIREAVADKNAASRLHNPRVMVEKLLREERISSETAKIIEDLRKLRNEAAHLPTFAIEPDQALEYQRLAGRVVAALSLIYR
jgi:hypothetical protein